MNDADHDFCPLPKCGQAAGRGHPRSGWVRVHTVPHPPVWYCSPEHAVHGLQRSLPAEVLALPFDGGMAGAAVAVALLAEHGARGLTVVNCTPERLDRAYAIGRLVLADRPGQLAMLRLAYERALEWARRPYAPDDAVAARREAVRALLAEGVSVLEIARRLDITQDIVYADQSRATQEVS